MTKPAKTNAKRFHPESMRNRLIRACDEMPGMTLPEIMTYFSNEKRTVVAAMVSDCVICKEIFRAGVKRRSKYYASEEEAREWDAVALKVMKEEQAIKLKERHKALQEQRKAERQAVGAKMGRPPRKSPAKTKLTTAVKIKGAITIRGKASQGIIPAHHTFKQAATVVWPDHVKVQVIPHGVDNRLKFTPPPGWVGEITKDSIQRLKKV